MIETPLYHAMNGGQPLARPCMSPRARHIPGDDHGDSLAHRLIMSEIAVSQLKGMTLMPALAAMFTGRNDLGHGQKSESLVLLARLH